MLLWYIMKSRLCDLCDFQVGVTTVGEPAGLIVPDMCNILPLTESISAP